MSGNNNVSSTIRIFLLGRFEVVKGEQTLQAQQWQRRKAAALLQRVALEKRLLRDEALEFLWPETDPTSAANNLYRTLYSLRQTLDEALGEGAAEATISYSDGVLRLGSEVWVDAHAFETVASRDEADRAALEEAFELYEGPLLPESVYDDWTIQPREVLQRLYRDVALELAQTAGDARAMERAVVQLRPFLEDDPADEVVHRKLMQLFARLGRRHDALRQYQSCVAALEEELGVPPMPETRKLYEQILSGSVLATRDPTRTTTAAPPPAEDEHSTGTPFAGRKAELERLMAHLEAVAQGRGKTVLLKGVTGVGKTRLAREFLREAAAQGMLALSGSAYEYEQLLAYQPFAEAIDRYLARTGRARSENPITNFKPQAGDPQQEKWALFSNTAAFLTELAAEAPVLLFIDDLHAADEASLQLFHYLARHTRSQPLLLAATYRTDIVQDPASPLNSLLNALYREGLRDVVALEPLDAAAVGELVRHIHGGEVAPSLIAAIVQASEGNPFFAEEMSRAMLQSEQLMRDSGGVWRLKEGLTLKVPADLQELLRELIAQSGPPLASALESAAIMGRAFNFEILRRVSVLDERDLLDALDAALKAGLIKEMERGYEFHHGLLRHALYQGQSRRRRMRMHALVAMAMEEARQAGWTEPESYPETVAHHYERSDRRDCALPYLVQAGQRAAALYAFEGAVDYYKRALALMNELGLEERAQRWELLESLGWWEKVLADTPRAVAHFGQALALEPDDEWESQPHERARVHAGTAMAFLSAGDTEAAEPHLQAAMEQIDEETHASEYADILYNVSQLHWHRNEYQQAFEMAQRSLDVAEQLDDSTLVARAFEMLALACHSLGEWQQGLQYEEKRSAIAGPELDVSDAFDVHL